MLIALSTPTYDLDGELLLSPLMDDIEDRYTRRVERTALLDGGSYVDDLGYSEGDRTLRFEVPYTQATFDRLRYLLRQHGRAALAHEAGWYSGALTTLERAANIIRFEFLAEAV